MKEQIESLTNNYCTVQFSSTGVMIVNSKIASACTSSKVEFYVWASTFEETYSKAVAKGWVA